MELKWRKPDASAITKFLCEEHDFSTERVSKAVERLLEASDTGQKTLENGFDTKLFDKKRSFLIK